MQHFFVTPEQVRGEYIYISGTDVNHIKNVLRMKTGEELEVSDGNNHRYLGSVAHIQQDEVCVNIIAEQSTDQELPSNIYLFQGLPKNDKMEYIIQKAVELGAYQVVPVATKRAVVKLDEKKAAKKTERWNEIAKSAAKQSGRSVIPLVTGVKTYKEALVYAGQENIEVLLIPYELTEDMIQTKGIIEQIISGQSVAVFIGPEGGFDKSEIELAIHQGFRPVTLGKRILRTETASLAILSILMYHLEK